MPQFRVRIEETDVYEVIVTAKNQGEAEKHGLEAHVHGYGDFLFNIEREVISVKKAGD